MKLKLKNVTSYHKEYFTELDLSKKNKHIVWTKWLWKIYHIKLFLQS